MSTTFKFILLVVGAAILALVARMLFTSTNQPSTPAAEPVRLVMTATADLPAGLLLRSEDVEWQEMPRSKVPEGAILEGSANADTLAGFFLRREVRSGAAVKSRDVIRHDSPGFLAAALQPGMRAVSVPIDNVSGNAGLIQPGDHVDMILIQQTRSPEIGIGAGRARSVVSETVVENVRVIAVGSDFQENEGKSGSSGRQAAARTITIEVQPRAAEAVAVASRLGTLSLALRSFVVTDPGAHKDEQAGAIVAWEKNGQRSAPVWAGDVSRAIINLDAADSEDDTATSRSSSAEPRSITIMRGSERNTRTIGGVSEP